jgi:S1-C subfamily serine protease
MCREVERRGLILLAALVSLGSACKRPHDWGNGSSSPASAPSPAPAPAPSAAVPAGAAVTPKIERSPQATALSSAFETTAKAIGPSVVRIDVEETFTPNGTETIPDSPDFLRRFFGFHHAPEAIPEGVLRGTGSGVIVDSSGDVLTNSHVVRGAKKVTIQLADQRSFPARVVGTDPLTDVGVVRFEKPPSGLVAARLGDSNKLHIGEWAIAVGSPLGMDQTVTVGIISGVGPTGSHFRFESGERIRRYIQTDAKINPGNSGGPLVNLEAEVVGINTLINVGPGGSYGFAIPINEAWLVAGTLIKEGVVRYPYLGVRVMTLTPALRTELERETKSLPAEGAFVGDATLNGPAASVGLKVGDVITKIGGHAVKTANDLVDAVSEQRIGASVRVDYWRDGGQHSASVTVGEYPSQTAPKRGEARIGLALQTLTEPIARSLGLDPRTKGAVVTEVAPVSPAEQAGLAVGDVIREVDRKAVQSADDAVAAMRAGKGPRLLRVTNSAGTRFVSVTPR